MGSSESDVDQDASPLTAGRENRFLMRISTDAQKSWRFVFPVGSTNEAITVAWCMTFFEIRCLRQYTLTAILGAAVIVVILGRYHWKTLSRSFFTPFLEHGFHGLEPHLRVCICITVPLILHFLPGFIGLSLFAQSIAVKLAADMTTINERKAKRKRQDEETKESSKKLKHEEQDAATRAEDKVQRGKNEMTEEEKRSSLGETTHTQIVDREWESCAAGSNARSIGELALQSEAAVNSILAHSSVQDLQSLTVEKLKEMCKGAQIKVSGTKMELVHRLQAQKEMHAD